MISLSKEKAKLLKSFQMKKFRQKYNVFVVEGDKLAREILADNQFSIEYIVALESWLQEYAHLLKKHKELCFSCTETQLSDISSLTTANKVLIVAKMPPPQYPENFELSSYALYLDGIQDPGNFGTIMRIADWFSIPYIFCSDKCVDAWHQKVIQASMGAFLRVKCIEIPFMTLKEKMPNTPILATILRGENIFELDAPKTGIIVVGNEGAGISDDIIELADYKISIPGGGGAESLNAAVATGIVAAILTKG